MEDSAQISSSQTTTAARKLGHGSPYLDDKIKALFLAPKLLRDYVDNKCPICFTMKRRQPKNPSSSGDEEKRGLKPCQKVYVDTSGKCPTHQVSISLVTARPRDCHGGMPASTRSWQPFCP